MIGDQILTFRKAKGMTQEELAVKLHIVRQTVSKWEKGLSVPDAQMLISIGEMPRCDSSPAIGRSTPDIRSAGPGKGTGKGK